MIQNEEILEISQDNQTSVFEHKTVPEDCSKRDLFEIRSNFSH